MGNIETVVSFHYMAGQMQDFLNWWHRKPMQQFRLGRSRYIEQSPTGSSVLQQFRQCHVRLPRTLDGKIYEITVHDRLRVLFAHIFRTGGTSVNDFARARGARHLTHLGEDQDSLRRIWFDDSLFRAAIVRDPLERALSAFREAKCRTGLE